MGIGNPNGGVYGEYATVYAEAPRTFQLSKRLPNGAGPLVVSQGGHGRTWPAQGPTRPVAAGFFDPKLAAAALAVFDQASGATRADDRAVATSTGIAVAIGPTAIGFGARRFADASHAALILWGTIRIRIAAAGGRDARPGAIRVGTARVAGAGVLATALAGTFVSGALSIMLVLPDTRCAEADAGSIRARVLLSTAALPSHHACGCLAGSAFPGHAATTTCV